MDFRALFVSAYSARLDYNLNAGIFFNSPFTILLKQQSAESEIIEAFG
jgi:hypothetical protein